MRLDTWLSTKVTWRSRSDLQKRIERGDVTVNGQRSRKGQRVHPADLVVIQVDGPARTPTDMAAVPLHILFEDEWIIALNKVSGTVVHPVGQHVNDTIVSALHVRHHQQERPGQVPPMIVHRLDRDTSGVLVLAKDEQVRKQLGMDFETRRMRKMYLAVADGVVEHDQWIIDEPIGPDPSGRHKAAMACVPDGKPSLTEVEVLEKHPRHSIVRCRPHTGRQHQIRVHLSHVGHPILCDQLYGTRGPLRAGDLDDRHPAPDIELLDRQALHAEALDFQHPITQRLIRLRAPLPEDMATLVHRIPPFADA